MENRGASKVDYLHIEKQAEETETRIRMENVGKKNRGLTTTDAIILVGHEAPASDTPNDLIAELKRLEAERHQQKMPEMIPREAELDKLIREWPRTPKTDPYNVL